MTKGQLSACLLLLAAGMFGCADVSGGASAPVDGGEDAGQGGASDGGQGGAPDGGGGSLSDGGPGGASDGGEGALSDLGLLSFKAIGHVDLPGFNSLINFGQVGGIYPHQPVADGDSLFIPIGSFGSQGGFLVVSVADPTTPRIVGSYGESGSENLVIDRGVLVNATGQKLDVVDVTEVRAPQRLGSLDLNPSGLGYSAVGVALLGTTAYVTGGGCCPSGSYGDFPAILAVDVTDPSQPIKRGASTELGGAHIAVTDSLAFVAAYSSGLRLYSLAVPTTPALLSSIGTAGDARRVVVVGDKAYVLNYGSPGSLAILDVSAPARPLLLGVATLRTQLYTAPSVAGFAIDGPLAYVPTTGGVMVVDVANPESPTVVDHISSGYFTGGILARSPYIVVVNAAGVDVLEVTRLGGGS